MIQLGEFTREYDEHLFEKDYMDYLKGEVSEFTNVWGMPESIRKNAQKIDSIIKDVRVADPAIGSGAFPLGMLNEIVKVRNILTQYILFEEALKNEKLDIDIYKTSRYRIYNTRSLYNLKIETIENSLYGVDIEPSAVDIAKLRLWLSIVVDTRDNDIRPLPNLDFNFMVGNSLIDEFDGVQLFDEKLLTKRLKETYTETTNKLFNVATSYQRDLFAGTESLKADIMLDLDKKHKEFFKERNTDKKKEIKNKIEELEWILITETLTASGNVSKIKELEKLKQQKRKPYFLWKLEFAKVFQEKGGFDIIIGNPPYGAKIEKKELDLLKKRFKSNENTNSVAIFMDFAMNYWLKKEGIISMIVPKSLLYSEKWFKLVLNLINHTTLLVDVEKAFEKVKLEQVFYVSNFKKKIESYHAKKFLNNKFLNSNDISIKIPLNLYSWICDITSFELEILNHIFNNVKIKYMKNICDVKRGIGLQKLLKDTGEIEVIGGKQCQRYFKDGIRGYLSEEDLKGNQKKLEFMLQKKLEFMLQKKLISQDLVAHIQNPLPHIKLSTFFDEKGSIIGLDTIQNIVLNNSNYDYRYILGLLNSNFINWYTYKFIYSSAIRTMHFDKNYIGKIIIPDISLDKQKDIIDCVKEIENNINNFEIKKVLEDKINDYVYKLFDLNETQIESIKINFKGD